MDETLRLTLTYLGAPLVAYVMWVKIARPLGKWIVFQIKPGPFRDMLTKDRGGYY